MGKWVSLLHEPCVSCSDLFCGIYGTRCAAVYCKRRAWLTAPLASTSSGSDTPQTIARLRFITLGSSFPYGNEEPVCNIPARVFLNSSHCSAAHREGDKGSLRAGVAGFRQIQPLRLALEQSPSISAEDTTHGWCRDCGVRLGAKQRRGRIHGSSGEAFPRNCRWCPLV